MKKISRIQKSKVIERVKTIVIVLLFFSCLFLSYQIFQTYRDQAAGDGLWGGINLSGESIGKEGGSNKNTVTLFNHLTEPSLILVNGVGGRSVIQALDKNFKVLSNISNSIVYDSYRLGSDRLSLESEDEWRTALKLNSVYMSYPANRSTWYESESYRIKNSGLSNILKNYSETLVVPAGERTVTIFFRDKVSRKVVKARLDTEEAQRVSDILNEYNAQNEKKYTFAFELNLDEQTSGKASLNSMLLINTEKLEASDIVADVPKVYKMGLNFTKTTEFATELINIFGYNPNTVRQYVSSEDALTFVGENGSLSVYPEGKIEYKALGPNEGIFLADAGQTGVSAANSGLWSIMERVIMASGVHLDGSDFDIKFTNMPGSMATNERAEICLDYFVDGKKVIFNSTPAVYAAIEDGVLVEFRMQVKDIKKLASETTLDSILTEIDRFCAANPENKIISSSSIIYRYNNNGEEIKAMWQTIGTR